MKIVFVVMSAVNRVEAVRQLAACLAPHTVVIHHDFSQTPDFEVRLPNVVFVPEPRRTGWCDWKFTEGILHTLRHCLDNFDFDYLQMLSPTSLPIKPIHEFEDFLASNDVDVYSDCIDLRADLDAYMTAGWRIFSASGSLVSRVLRRAAAFYFAGSDRLLDTHGVQLRQRRESGDRPGGIARFSLELTRLAERGAFGRTPFGDSFMPSFGSPWFTARPDACRMVLNRLSDRTLSEYFSRVYAPDEFHFATLFLNGEFRVQRSNHLVNGYDGARPRWFGEDDMGILAKSDRFFARKFIDDPDAVIRTRVLAELVGKR